MSIDRCGLCPPIAKDPAVAESNKPISLSDIHDVYSGSPKKRDTSQADESQPTYRKTNRFAREAGHTGVAANRTPSPPGRKTR